MIFKTVRTQCQYCISRITLELRYILLQSAGRSTLTVMGNHRYIVCMSTYGK